VREVLGQRQGTRVACCEIISTRQHHRLTAAVYASSIPPCRVP
jgi:hypothetical protein